MSDFNKNCAVCTHEPVGMSPQGIAILQDWHRNGHPETKTTVNGLVPPSPLGKKYPADKPKRPDQVDALDAAFDTIRKDGKPLIREAHIADAKAKLSALLVDARIDELNRLNAVIESKTLTTLIAIDRITDRIKELEKQREAME